jgi:hypothetical protein
VKAAPIRRVVDKFGGNDLLGATPVLTQRSKCGLNSTQTDGGQRTDCLFFRDLISLATAPFEKRPELQAPLGPGDPSSDRRQGQYFRSRRFVWGQQANDILRQDSLKRGTWLAKLLRGHAVIHKKNEEHARGDDAFESRDYE